MNINMNINNFKINRKWKKREVIIFLEQLSLYMSAGLQIDRALVVIQNSSPKHLQIALHKIRTSIESGMSFSKSFSQLVSNSSAVTSLIHQGELVGDLGKALYSAKVLLERGEELSKKCWSAMIYPLVIGFFACLLTLGLVRGVMPQIIPMLLSLHVKLPLLTRVVIWCSSNIIDYGLWIAIACTIVVASFVYSYKKLLPIREVVQRGILGLPVIGGAFRSYCSSVFLRSCGTMIESGMSVSDAYKGTTEGVFLIPLKKRYDIYSDSLYRGQTLSRILSASEMKFPSFVPALVSVGEASGTLSVSLINSANIIDKDIEYMLKKLTALIEPVMMAGMGSVVGSIALSIIMPIYDISKVLQR
jgi:type II secretory pathway component PulF